MTYRAIIFDWDGTLVDTAEASYRCFVRVFGDFGIDFSRELYSSTYSPNWYHTFRILGLPEQHWPEADRKWLDYFACESPHLIPGAVEALQRLTRHNIIGALVTGGSRSRVERELAKFGLNDHFVHVLCGDDGHERKPHPEALNECLSRIGVDPAEAAYVGDSAEDVMMSRAAGVFAVGVRGTYPNYEALSAASPDLLVESVEEAVDALLR